MDIPSCAWLIAIPISASVLVYLSGYLIKGRSAGSINQWLALIALLATWVAFGITASQVGRDGPIALAVGDISLQCDGVSLLLAAITLGLGTLVVLYSGACLSNETGQEKYYAMIVAMIGVIMGLGCANDLFNLWIWFEAMAVCSYLLVVFYRDQPMSLEAGLKYLAQGATGSVFILLAIGLVISQSGTVQLQDLRASLDASAIVLAAGVLFVIGFGVKAALVPLHTWLPDAHSQAPSGISAMLSGVVIEAGLIAMLRALSALPVSGNSWSVLLLGFGALNMLVGNLMALRQTQVKRLLAYSSLTHMGYMLVGVGIAIYAGVANAAQGGFFHLFNHGLMKGLAFLAAGTLLYTMVIQFGGHEPLTINDLAGAARRYPLVALALSLALLGLGGLPPLAGFMSKWQIFEAGFETHDVVIEWLIIFAALNSVLSLAYYAPLVNVVYRKQPSRAILGGSRVPIGMSLSLVMLAVSVLVIGVWPSVLNWLTMPAGSALLAAFR
ncbi:MAG: hypothetical protein GTO18_12030 [Anaerolineales bacterium]|nr:hypothetical protein [Anaerolineales bacterium]